ncbi:MAG TPA: L-seryl-tRNA(Sec) selenium transferase [Planctomycetaceae bacterium]|nr:L-seryl-tRNA(Sec) selenium transferase [Planctomycetaceae bacterium]
MNDASQENFRELPPVNEIMTFSAIAPLIDERGRECVRDWVRAAVADLRERIAKATLNGSCSRRQLTGLAVQFVYERAEAESSEKLGNVINATGVVLHTSLGRAPLCEAAIAAVREAASALNLEVDLATGERRYRGYQLQSAWRRLTGAEAALVVNNNAAATVLALEGLCRGREVVISRGQLIEIGGSFRLPEVFAQSGAVLREVGTTNRTRLADYESAIGPATAALLRVHPSNYRVEGFAETPEIDELSALAHRYGLTCLDDIGSGCLVETVRFGLPQEPTFQQSLAAGADLVLGSGDKLLGGPQCGIMLGRAELIERLSAHPLARSFRIDKLTLAALSATLDVYLRGEADREIPTLALLAASRDELLARARKIHADLALGRDCAATGVRDTSLDNGNLQDAAGTLRIEVATDQALVGGGSLPGASLPTAVLRLSHPRMTVDVLARRMRLGSPRVFGRIQENALVLDLRSVLPADDERIAAAIRSQIANSH